MQPVVIKRSRIAVGLAIFMCGLVATVLWTIVLGILVSYPAFSFAAQVMVSITGTGGVWRGLVRHFSPTTPAVVMDERGLVDQASPCVQRDVWTQVMIGHRVERVLRKDSFGTHICDLRLLPRPEPTRSGTLSVCNAQGMDPATLAAGLCRDIRLRGHSGKQA